MKILGKDLKRGRVDIRIQSQTDLWFLSHILETGDLVSGVTQRKIKSERSDTVNVKTYTRTVRLTIRAEKIEFHSYTDALRVSGKIVEAPEDIPKGSYHTFTLEPDVTASIVKEQWKHYQLDRLEEAAKHKEANVLICVFDREKALFAELRSYGFEVLAELSGDLQKKASPEKIKSSSYYQNIVKIMKDYDQKSNYSKVIVASPAFWREYLLEVLDKEELKSKVITSACNSVDLDGINEVLKRPEVATALKEDRVVQEMGLVEELLIEIKKDGPVAYGLKETRDAVQAGAAKILLVTDSFLRLHRDDGSYAPIDRLLAAADGQRAPVKIISALHEGGKKLDGLGGIGAILRYKLTASS
jgi:protein pelota